MFDMFVVDFMHEVEIGVWKSLFIHLIRLLQAFNPSCIQALDQRYMTNFQLIVEALTVILGFEICQLLVLALFEGFQQTRLK